MIAKTSTYPKGPHRNFPQDTIVQALTTVAGTLRFRDTTIGELEDNQEYYVPLVAESEEGQPRSAEQVLDWMEGNKIEVNYMTSVDGEEETLELYREFDRNPLVKYPFGKGALKEAVEFCMDKEDQSK